MTTAIIVVSVILAAGLVALFVTVGVLWRREYKKPLQGGTPRKKQTAKEWIKNHLPSKRRLIQVYAALLYNANIKGYISGEIYQSKTTKYLCVPGLNCYSCPGAVGACPLGSLQNALAESKTSAPYYVLGILAIFGLMLGRTICGFLCPVGLGQELLYKIRTPKLKKSRATRVLSYFKYVLLAVLVIAIPLIYASVLQMPGFCKYVCPAGTFGGALLLLINPHNTGMFANLGPMFTWKFCVLVAMIVAAIFIYRFFCRFFCPLGAIYGFFNRIALLGIKVDHENCTDCGLCVSHCKMDVKRVGDHECINCGECIPVCPTKAIRWKGSKLFVHGNTIAEPAEERPLGKMSVTVAEPVAAEPVAETVAESVASEPVISGPVAEPTSEAVVAAPAPKAKKPKKSAKFWVELSAWICALLLLVGALVYYNAIDVEKPAPGPVKPTPDVGYKVGETAPDFTVELLGEEGGTFNLYENRGTLTVVNFWATWCGGCKSELPYFNRLAANHAEWTVLAIHGDSMGSGSATDYIAANYGNSSIVFAQDKIEGSTCVTFRSLGGRNTWPLTVIVDEEGKVIYNSTFEFKSYEQLETAVLTAKGANN